MDDPIDALVRLAREHADPAVRGQSLAELGEQRDPRALQALRMACGDPREPLYLRVVALHALGDSGLPAALPALATALTDPADMLRQAAVFALGQLADNATPELPLDEVASMLEAALSDTSARVRSDALYALGSLKGRQPSPLLLMPGLSDPAPEVRAAAAQALGAVGDARAAPALLRALSDPDAYVQSAAAAAWGCVASFRSSSPPEALACLANRHAAAHVRAVIGRTLASHRHLHAGANLLDALVDATAPILRADLLEALAEVPDKRAFRVAADFLGDTEEMVRGAAALLLAAIGDDAAIALLAPHRLDPSPYVRRRVVRALGLFEPWATLPAARRWRFGVLRTFGRRAPCDVAPLLMDSLADASAPVVDEAAEALAWHLGGPALRGLLDDLRPEWERARDALERALENASQEAPCGPRRAVTGTVHVE